MFETLAVLVALKLWSGHAAQGRLRLSVKSDSLTAISAVLKGCGRGWVVNALAAQITLVLTENALPTPDVTHVAGVDNKIADALSRLSEGADCLDANCARRRTVPRRDGRLLRLAAYTLK